jgi:hypothetical protein
MHLQAYHRRTEKELDTRSGGAQPKGQGGKQLTKVADKLKIKYSTAKTILRVYKNEGRMNKKKKRAPRRHKGQEPPRPAPTEALKILQFPRTLPVPDKLKQMHSSECLMWETIFINRFE